MTDAERTRRTFRLEFWRAIAQGILETAASTFLLLIAVRWYGAGAVPKALIAAGSSIGLLITPVIVTFVSRRRLSPSEASFRLLLVGAAGFLAPVVAPWLPVYVLGSVLGMTMTAAVIPLLTQMYQENYPTTQRGLLFSRTFMVRILTAALFARFAGWYLTGHLDRFRELLLVFALASATAAWLLRRCPTAPIADAGGDHPLRALRFVRDDVVFRRTLVAWMLMGFGNLMMMPLRVEYLAHERYALHLPADQIALYTSVVPNLARLAMSPVWGWLFDRMNFFALRVALNVGFIVGILSFFTTNSTTGLVLGAIVYGVSNAGGDVAWSLWVTKFAPPERVADYMSVHTSFTGLRGVLAPVVAFQLVGVVALPVLGWIAATLIASACLVLAPELVSRRRARPAAALVEEVSE